MRINAGNTVFLGYFPAKNIYIDSSVREVSLGNSIPSPVVRVRGDQTKFFAKVLVRWEPVPFYYSRYYVEFLPLLWRIFRRVYNQDGKLRQKIFQKVVQEEVNNFNIPADFEEIRIAIYEHTGLIRKEDNAIVFPTTIDPYWRPAVLVWYMEKEEIPKGAKITPGMLSVAPDAADKLKYIRLPDSELPLPGKIIFGWDIEEEKILNYHNVLLVVLRKKKVSRKIRFDSSKVIASVSVSLTSRKVRLES